MAIGTGSKEDLDRRAAQALEAEAIRTQQLTDAEAIRTQQLTDAEDLRLRIATEKEATRVKEADERNTARENELIRCEQMDSKNSIWGHAKLEEGKTEEDWITFVRQWDRYKKLNSRMTEDTLVHKLWLTISSEVDTKLGHSDKEGVETLSELLARIRAVVVVKRSIWGYSSELHSLVQDKEENHEQFHTRLANKAVCCKFRLPEGETDYSKAMIMDRLMVGTHDSDFREKIYALNPRDGEEDVKIEDVLALAQNLHTA